MEPEPKRQRLVCRHKHFVLRYLDETLDYKKICEEIFDGGQYHCVREYDEHGKEHVHFQGLCSWTDKTLAHKTEGYITQVHRLYREHLATPQSKKPRLVSHSHKVCNETGYCYMSKDPRRVVIATTFSEEEISAFAERSAEYVTKLKTEFNEYLWSRLTTKFGRVQGMDFKVYKKEARLIALRFYESQEKPVPFNCLETKVLNALFYWKIDGRRVISLEAF